MNKRDKTKLINQSLSLISDNPNHTFFAVTIRPFESFIKNINWNDRVHFVELFIQNLIYKYQSHLTPLNTDKPQNHHLKLIAHNAIETKTKYGSPDIPHSHSLWGIPNELLHKWGSENGVFHQWKNDDLTRTICLKGHIHIRKEKITLNRVIHSVEVSPLNTNPIEQLYDTRKTPEGWLDYSYKWFGDGKSEWSFVSTPITKTKRRTTNAPSAIKHIPPTNLQNQSVGFQVLCHTRPIIREIYEYEKGFRVTYIDRDTDHSFYLDLQNEEQLNERHI